MSVFSRRDLLGWPTPHGDMACVRCISCSCEYESIGSQRGATNETAMEVLITNQPIRQRIV